MGVIGLNCLVSVVVNRVSPVHGGYRVCILKLTFVFSCFPSTWGLSVCKETGFTQPRVFPQYMGVIGNLVDAKDLHYCVSPVHGGYRGYKRSKIIEVGVFPLKGRGI